MMKRATLVILLVYIGLTYLLFLGTWNQIVALASEDGLIEYIGTIACFVGCVFFFLTYRKSASGNRLLFWKTKRNVFFLLFAIGLLFIGGEEVSWGQRIIHAQTPGVFAGANAQGEMNIHNLAILEDIGPFEKSFNLAFIVAVLTYCVVIPILKIYSTKFANFIERINLPLTAPSLCLLAVVIIAPMEIIKRLSDPLWQRYVGEIRESNLQLLFMMMGLWFFASVVRREELVPLLPLSNGRSSG